ncbi:MAG TPA: winged helix-turn-helix domain-containing protein [Pyrinomonadaceae bacterium]
MFSHASTSYEFGPFLVDPRERQLMRNGEVVPLRPKVFDILLMLVENSGHILTKDDVMKHVWSNTAVEEGNISRTISTLRNALGEGRYIETIPWRGYRFVANVREIRTERVGKKIDSIAVLPFVNVDADVKSEYLADGITEGVITSLAQLTSLRVISRNSVFRYKGREVDTQSVGRKLKVQALLLGRVVRSDEMLSISVELIDTDDDRHLWGAQYIRNPAALAGTYETIAQSIREKLRLPLGEQPPRVATQNHEAHLSYLKGRYYFNKLTPDGVQTAIDHLQHAIELDPVYALAYAALGDCHNYLAHREEAKNALLRALEVDETLGEAHASMGFFKFLYDWDFSGAEEEFKRALALSPSYAEAHHWYAIYLANVGRHAEADEHARRAIELDPLSLLMNMTPALNFYLAREYDNSIAELHKVIEMEPNFVAARSVMGNALSQSGRHDEAMIEYRKALELIKGATTAEISLKALMAHAYATRGKRSDALELLDEIILVDTASPYLIAGIYGALGQSNSAFEWLNKAYDQRDVQLVSLKVDPFLDPLRQDERFAELVNRVGLPQ